MATSFPGRQVMRISTVVLAAILTMFLVPACGDSDYDTEVTTTPGPTVDAPPKIPSKILTDKQGEQLMGQRCLGCHSNNRIKIYKHSYQDWVFLLRNGSCREALLSPLDRLAIAYWLSKKYGTEG
jgi:hypothetical protein